MYNVPMESFHPGEGSCIYGKGSQYKGTRGNVWWECMLTKRNPRNMLLK